MATSVYSTLFIAAAGTDISAGYVVPSGMVAVVRDVSALCEGAPDDTAAELLDNATGTYIWYRLFQDPFEFDHWDGRQVVPAGATFTAASSGPQIVHVRVSGYLLTLP